MIMLPCMPVGDIYMTGPVQVSFHDETILKSWKDSRAGTDPLM